MFSSKALAYQYVLSGSSNIQSLQMDLEAREMQYWGSSQVTPLLYLLDTNFFQDSFVLKVQRQTWEVLKSLRAVKWSRLVRPARIENSNYSAVNRWIFLTVNGTYNFLFVLQDVMKLYWQAFDPWITISLATWLVLKRLLCLRGNKTGACFQTFHKLTPLHNWPSRKTSNGEWVRVNK